MIVRCRFPFPDQDPPVVMPEPCSAKCPNYDADAFARHADIPEDAPEFLAAIRSFIAWFYRPGEPEEAIEEQIRDAALAAARGEPVPSWPDGEEVSGTTWNLLFAKYSARYDRPD